LFVIQTQFFPFSEIQLALRSRGDLLLVMLGSVIAAIGLGALGVHVFRRRYRERFLLWFGLFACPYGLRLLSNTSTFRLAFGEPQRPWLFIAVFVDLAMIIPALLLFEDFYGKGWRSSVRTLIWLYTAFATTAFASMLVANRPNLFPAAGIGTVFLLPLIVLVGRITGYRRRRIEGQRLLSFGLLILFLTFATRSLCKRTVTKLARTD
jgi:sigma-B regulation protein RsbU (phosphoserine phosphatase)